MTLRDVPLMFRAIMTQSYSSQFKRLMNHLPTGIRRAYRYDRRLQQLYALLAPSKFCAPKVKFVMLGKYRVGSNYLAHLLNSHPDIEVHGELFNVGNLAYATQWVHHPKRCIGSFFAQANSGSYAKGFKLMYNQLSVIEFDVDNWPPYLPERLHYEIERLRRRIRTPLAKIERNFDDALRYMIGVENVKVVHLKRRNMLDTLLSMKKALLEDNWKGAPYNTEKIQLTTSECEKFFRETLAQQTRYASIFSQCPTFDLYYEDLLANRNAVLHDLQTFLEVPPCPALSAPFGKQGRTSRSCKIDNYDLLQRHFEGTEWGHFF